MKIAILKTNQPRFGTFSITSKAILAAALSPSSATCLISLLKPGACLNLAQYVLLNPFVRIMPRLARSPNLKVLLRTAVVNTTRLPSGEVASITVVQRSPRDNYTEYDQRFSDVFADWSVLTLCGQPLSSHLPCRYSPDDSPYFTKQLHTISGKVFVEATEFGDLLVTAQLPYAQGVEVGSLERQPLCIEQVAFQVAEWGVLARSQRRLAPSRTRLAAKSGPPRST